jgi:hypothetical protein
LRHNSATLARCPKPGLPIIRAAGLFAYKKYYSCSSWSNGDGLTWRRGYRVGYACGYHPRTLPLKTPPLSAADHAPLFSPEGFAVPAITTAKVHVPISLKSITQDKSQVKQFLPSKIGVVGLLHGLPLSSQGRCRQDPLGIESGKALPPHSP